MLRFILHFIQSVFQLLQKALTIIDTFGQLTWSYTLSIHIETSSQTYPWNTVYILKCRLQGNPTHSKILITGPSNAGKTTLAHKLRTEAGGKVDWRETAKRQRRRQRLTFVETSGFAAPPLSTFLPGTAGILFMLDAKDYDLFPGARRMLDGLFKSGEVAGVPVVIFVNKIDQYAAMGPEEVLRFLGLDGNEDGVTGLDILRRERAVEVMFGSVVLGQGVDEAIWWLAEHV
ncbi:P-loop containing nucleoside triphosphate hydrolase protein [Aspergillus carlsbadensis]|nr:P-loop containing nucleoside triphosphate hydrolase protein [Aspergillus carlsbadensis]